MRHARPYARRPARPLTIGRRPFYGHKLDDDISLPMNGETPEERLFIETLIRAAFAGAERPAAPQRLDLCGRIVRTALIGDGLMVAFTAILFRCTGIELVRTVGAVLFLILIALIICSAIITLWASISSFVKTPQRLLNRGLQQLWERRRLAEQLAKLCTTTFLRARVNHLRHPHDDMQTRDEVFVGKNSKTTSLFGTLAFGSALVALSNNATKLLSTEHANLISENIIPVLGIYVVVVFIIRTTAIARSGLEPGFLVLEEAIAIRKDLDSKASEPPRHHASLTPGRRHLAP